MNPLTWSGFVNGTLFLSTGDQKELASFWLRKRDRNDLAISDIRYAQTALPEILFLKAKRNSYLMTNIQFQKPSRTDFEFSYTQTTAVHI